MQCLYVVGISTEYLLRKGVRLSGASVSEDCTVLPLLYWLLKTF